MKKLRLLPRDGARGQQVQRRPRPQYLSAIDRAPSCAAHILGLKSASQSESQPPPLSNPFQDSTPAVIRGRGSVMRSWKVSTVEAKSLCSVVKGESRGKQSDGLVNTVAKHEGMDFQEGVRVPRRTCVQHPTSL